MLQREGKEGGRGAVVLDPEASYLVTGGLGALGLEVAQQLVADGARRLLLVSRRGPTTAAQQQVLARLTEAGATLQVVPADIADAAAVHDLFAQAVAMGPLRGIVHAAGVLDDGRLATLNASRVATVMGPKAAGAWHLHQQTQGMALDFFVAFSSVAALMGNVGQANYAAANGFLDGLMQQRHAQGLPGLSINWGAWAEVGMAAGLQEEMERQGWAMIAPRQGRALFRHLYPTRQGQVGVIPRERRPIPETTPARLSFNTTAYARASVEERQAMVVSLLRMMLATVGGFEASQLTVHQDLLSLGLDSLMALEMRDRIERLFAVRLPLSSLLLKGGSMASLAHAIQDRLTMQSLDQAMNEAVPQVADPMLRSPHQEAPIGMDDVAPDTTNFFYTAEEGEL